MGSIRSTLVALTPTSRSSLSHSTSTYSVPHCRWPRSGPDRLSAVSNPPRVWGSAHAGEPQRRARERNAGSTPPAALPMPPGVQFRHRTPLARPGLLLLRPRPLVARLSIRWPPLCSGIRASPRTLLERDATGDQGRSRQRWPPPASSRCNRRLVCRSAASAAARCATLAWRKILGSRSLKSSVCWAPTLRLLRAARLGTARRMVVRRGLSHGRRRRGGAAYEGRPCRHRANSVADPTRESGLRVPPRRSAPESPGRDRS